MEIKPLPDLSLALRHDAAAGKLVPFVGAGASRLAGCVGWDELASKSLEYLAKKEYLSWAELEHIRRLPVRTQLSIAKRVAAAKDDQIPFAEYLPVKRTHEHGVRLYAAISGLGSRFVTTNFDQWLDEDFAAPPAPAVPLEATPEGGAPAPQRPGRRNVVFKPEELEVGRFRDGTVMHLHGSVLDPSSMILSTEDYLRRYAGGLPGSKENKTLTFLRQLFGHHSVLFVGYSIEEPEILEYLLTKQAHFPGDEAPDERRYVLAPFFRYEAQLAEHLRDYWSDLNVELIPFLRDDKNYHQLIDVVEYLVRELPRPVAGHLRNRDEMEGLLDGS